MHSKMAGSAVQAASALNSNPGRIITIKVAKATLSHVMSADPQWGSSHDDCVLAFGSAFFAPHAKA